MSAPGSTPRSPRRRRRKHGPRPAAALARGLVVVALLGLIMVVALRAQNGLPLRDYKTMYATVPAVGDLKAHDPIRIGGLQVGQALDLQIAADGSARVELRLEPDAPPLPADTRVAVRAVGLLGARYIELVPGESRRILAEGATIRGTKDALTFGLPETLDTFDTETRARLGSMLRGLGAGMFGQGEQMNEGIRAFSRAQRPFQALAESVLSRPGAARRLLPSLDLMMSSLADSRDDLSGLFSPAASALQPFVDRRGAVRAALERAPSALSTATAGLGEGRRLLSATRALANAANETLPSAPAGLRAATTLLRTSDVPLRRAASLLREARPAVPAALRITSALSPVLDPLTAGLDDLSAIAAEIGPYGCDIENFAAVFRSVTGTASKPVGEVGPLGTFRLLASLAPLEDTSTTEGGANQSFINEGYPPPCKFSPGGEYVIAHPGGMTP